MTTQQICKCKACTSPVTEADKFVSLIHGRDNYWSAFDQGKFAALSCLPRKNPFALVTNVAKFDWDRGYDSVEHTKNTRGGDNRDVSTESSHACAKTLGKGTSASRGCLPDFPHFSP